MVKQADVQKDKVGKMWIKKEKETWQFLRTLEGEEAQEGEMSEIETFVKFSGGIWEREERMPNMTWTKEIRRLLNEKVNQVTELKIPFEKVKKEVAKRKGKTASSTGGIENYWWKKLELAQKALRRAFIKNKEVNMNIPIWWPTGRTMPLPGGWEEWVS